MFRFFHHRLFKRLVWGFLWFLGLMLILVALSWFSSGGPRIGEVVVSGKTFTVEIANTLGLREKGLSGHAPLADAEGMMFVFRKVGNYGFWMKDMAFPLDIIWMDEDFKIVHIEEGLLPDSYPKVFYPGVHTMYALELNSGQIEKLQIKLGDTVEFVKK